MGAKLMATTAPKQWYMCDLIDGDVAVITDTDGSYTGVVIHVYDDIAIAIGSQKGASWVDNTRSKLKVRKLQPGELIEIT